MVSDGLMDGRGDALLAPVDISQEMAWDAALQLAGHANDTDELREWLEMLGFAPYESGAVPNVWGHRRAVRKDAADEENE